MLRKPLDNDQVPAAACDTGTDGNDVISTIIMCKHKRGGMCITHGTKGTKVMESVKVWSKKEGWTIWVCLED